MNSKFIFSSKFWAQFVEKHWDKKPVVIKQPFATPFMTPAEVFQCLITASDHYRADSVNVPLQFFMEPAFQVFGSESGQYIPNADDASSADYAQRVTRMLQGQRFALILNGDFHIFDARLWMRLREFLRGLLMKVPVPLISSGVFLGNYERTPAFGIHRDDKNIFHFVIEGRKKMHLWRDDYFDGRDDRRPGGDYRRFLDDALTLEGEPGDVLFWPSSYWHLGESVGGLSVSLVIALGPHPQPSTEVREHLANLLAESPAGAAPGEKRSINLSSFRESATTLPPILKQTLRAVREASRHPDLEQSLRVFWLNRVTGFSSNGVPPPLPWQPLADDAIVRGNSHYPILWIPGGEDEIVCSANGHAFAIPADPHIIKLLERLNKGAALRVKNLIAEYSGTTQVANIAFEATPEGIRTLLEKLYSLRAITEGA